MLLPALAALWQLTSLELRCPGVPVPPSDDDDDDNEYDVGSDGADGIDDAAAGDAGGGGGPGAPSGAPTDDVGQLAAAHLPVALQELRLRSGAGLFQRAERHLTSRQPWLALERLTSLTRLSGETLVADGGVLPRRLRSLCVVDVSAAAPLLALPQLTRLSVRHCSMPASSCSRTSGAARS